MMTRAFAVAILLLGASSLAPSAQARSGGVSHSFRVGGEVAKETSFDLKKLKKLPAAKADVSYFVAGAVVTQSVTGVLLWDLLQSVGIVADPKVKNDILRKIIVVTGSDGYRSVFGAGEIDPLFGGSQIIVAYAEDGHPLGQEGFARIVAPGDKADGRFVSNIVNIEIRDAGQ